MSAGDAVEGWGVTVRSNGGLYGSGELLVGDGWIGLEARVVDQDKLAAAKRVRLGSFGIGALLVVAAAVDGENAGVLILLGLVMAAAGLAWTTPGWHLGGASRKRWRVEDLDDVRMGDDSDGTVLNVLVFGWLGLLLGSLTPQRWLRFSVPDDERGYVDYMIDVGSPAQFAEIAGKLRSLDLGERASLL